MTDTALHDDLLTNERHTVTDTQSMRIGEAEAYRLGLAKGRASAAKVVEDMIEEARQGAEWTKGNIDSSFFFFRFKLRNTGQLGPLPRVLAAIRELEAPV